MNRILILLASLLVVGSVWSDDSAGLIEASKTASEQTKEPRDEVCLAKSVDQVRDLNLLSPRYTQCCWITKPRSGAKWKTGKAYQIRWLDDSVGGKVRIDLYRADKYYKTIVRATANDGRYTWRIPSSIPSSTKYHISIKSDKTCEGEDLGGYTGAISITNSSSGRGGYKICKTGTKKIKWSSKKMRYYVNTKGGPSGALGAIKRGASVWNRVKGSSFKFIYRGRTTSRAHGKKDGKNIVAFGSLDKGYVGMNLFWYWTRTGYLFDSDIRFSTRYRWSTKKAKNAFDLQSVAAHEFGHSLCLKDLYGKGDKRKTMYGIFSYGQTHPRTLHPADKRGIQALY